MQVSARRCASTAIHSLLMPDDEIAGLSAASDLAVLTVLLRKWFHVEDLIDVGMIGILEVRSS